MENEYHYVSPTGLVYNSISRIPDFWNLYESNTDEFSIAITRKDGSPPYYNFSITKLIIGTTHAEYKRYKSFLEAEHAAMERIYIMATNTKKNAERLQKLADIKITQIEKEAQRMGVKIH